MAARCDRDRGQTGNAYNMVTDDVGSMIGCTVFATNTGGQASANALPVGPITTA